MTVLWVGKIMKSAILANAALCLCPPLVATTAVVTVPGARSAVHALTTPHHHAPKLHHDRAQPCIPEKRLTLAYDMAPPDVGAPDVLFAPEGEGSGQPLDLASIANGEPSVSRPQPFGVGGGSGIHILGPGPIVTVGTGPTMPVNPVPPVTEPTAVPEPASWLMMVTGFFGLGTLARRSAGPRNRNRRLKRVGIAAAAELLAPAGLGSGQTAVAASLKAGSTMTRVVTAALAKKAAVCVCSAAALTTAVTTVPPLKHAVYAATMPVHALIKECGVDKA
jgi:hypothetical protein